MVARELAHVIFEVGTLVTAVAVVPKDKDALVGAKTLFQEVTPQNRDAALEVSAVHVIVKRIHIAFEFKYSHTERIAKHNRVAVVVAAFQRRNFSILRRILCKGNRLQKFVRNRGIVDRDFIFLLAASHKRRNTRRKHKPQRFTREKHTRNVEKKESKFQQSPNLNNSEI